MQSSLTTEMTTLLDGKTPAVAMPMFSSVDHATSTYVRNPDGLLAGATGITAMSIYCPTQGNTYRKLVKLTPSIGMIAWHTRSAGNTHRFVAADNAVVEVTPAALPGGLSGYETYGEFLRIGSTDIGLCRITDLPEGWDGIDCLPLLDRDEYTALARWTVTYDIPLMGLLQGATTHPNGIASPRLLRYESASYPWPVAEWFEAVANYDSGSLLGFLHSGQFIGAIQVYTTGHGGGGAGPALSRYIAAINQAIADLGHPDEQLTVVSL